ncbi:MAG: hypothetical protein HY976_01010 [Candidatus Kerfeldbacteria bacterium]|nr:hypothetical protein [Candidatus Kerfeldbacteria bacterium]
MPRPVRSQTKVLAYAGVTAVAILGAVWMAMNPLERSSVNDNVNGARPTSGTRDRFQEVYDIAWRFDGNSGNTAVEAVFWFPGLVQRLGEYAERSAWQAETLQVIQAETDASLIPISVNLQRNAPLEREFDWENVVQVAGDGQAYQFERFDVSAFPSGRDDVLAGILWFRKVGASEPDRLMMTLSNIPGNVQPTAFSWDLKTLGLYDATPAEQNS